MKMVEVQNFVYRLADSIRPKNERERREYSTTALIIAALSAVALAVYSYLT